MGRRKTSMRISLLCFCTDGVNLAGADKKDHWLLGGNSASHGQGIP